MSPDAHPQATSTAGEPSWMAPVTPAIPDHELVRRIGGGSYGDVWLARTTVGTWRAVKVVFRDRFTDARPYEREFSGMLKFEPLSRGNEAFVDILQIGRNDTDGYFYYVMELADDAAEGRSDPCSVSSDRSGEPPAAPLRHTVNTDHCSLNTGFDPAAYLPKTLSKVLLQRGRLPVGECLELGLTLNLGLAQLHRAGLIHRDIKPSNIIFVGSVPKLADIGLVIEVAEARSFVGTEGFIPPEGPNSPQADLFSLGKVLYEAGMGKDRKDFPEPFTQLAEAPESTLLLEFNAILLKACAANRAERYQSAEEMNADLALLQSGGSVRRQRKAARQLRFVQRAGLLVSVVAAIIATGWWWQARQTRLVRQMATEKADLAENLSLLDRENRDRIVRLDVANGIQLLDQADHAGALVWLADALMRLTNKPAEEAVQRIRIGQTLNHIPRLLRVFGHTNGVLSVAFSPDGRRLATGTADGASVWDAATGARQLQWTGVGGPIREVRFADDGRKLFVSSCAPEGHVRSPTAPGFAAVLDAVAGSEVFPPLTNVYPAALSPDDRWLVVAKTNHTLQVLDAVTGQLHAELAGHASQIITLAFSRDGRLFASGDRDQKVRLWTLPSGAPAGPPIRLGQSLGRMALSPDGRRLVTRTAPGRGESHLIRTWNVGTGREIARPLVATPILNPLTFDPTGHRIITAELPPTLIVLDADSHVRLATLPHFRAMPHCWSFSPDGARFAVGSESGMAWVWDLESGAALTPGLHHHGPVESVQFSPDGSLLLTGGEDGLARLWDLATLEEAARPLDLPGSVVPLQPDLFPHAASPDGRHLLLPMETGVPSVDLSTLRIEGEPVRAPRGSWPYQMEFAADGSQWAVLTAIDQPADLPYQVRLWRTLGDRVEATALSHPRPVDAIGFSADGARLFSVTDDGLFWNWQAADAGLLKTNRLPAGYYLTLAIGPDGRHIVVQTKDGDVVLAPLGEPGKSPVRLGGDSLRAARFSPKGDRLAVVGSDPVGRVWNVETGQSIAAFRHGQSLLWIEWSPEGDRFVTAGPGMVRIWDARTGEALFTPMEHRLAARTARFSPDGRFLVTVCDDGTVRVWDAHNAEPVTAPLDQRTPKPRAAFLTASGRLATVSDPAVVRTWMLEPSPLPAGALSEVARWLSGRKLGSTGTVGDLQSDELSELAAALERKHPELLARAPSRIAEWHWRQVREPTSLQRVTAGLFHLRQLRELAPGEPGLEEQGLRLGRCLPPPRDPTSSSNLLDLSGFYTHSFGVLPRQEFADLPTGVQTFGGIPFDVRGLIRLQPLNSEFTLASLPLLAVGGIPVDRPSRQLHFLLGLDGAQAVEGDEVARWEIHQADGSVHLWPIVLGQQVGNTWNGDGVPAVVGQAVVAWEGHSPVARMAGADSLRLFKATWVNPRPEVAIRELEFTLGTANVRPFVVAITAD